MSGDDGFHLGHIFVAGALGAGVGAWWARNRKKFRSHAEDHDPDLVAAVCLATLEALEDVHVRHRLPNEDAYRDDLAEFLDGEIEDATIEVEPYVDGMKPDVLVEDVLALEVKKDPSKGEIDRAVGQITGYSRLWVTWLVLFESSPSQAGKALRLLERAGLDDVLVIAIPEAEEEDYLEVDELDDDSDELDDDSDELDDDSDELEGDAW